MSMHTEWARVEGLSVEVVDSYTDAFGQGLDSGGVALVLGADSVVVIEASSVGELAGLGEEIRRVCAAFVAAGEGRR